MVEAVVYVLRTGCRTERVTLRDEYALGEVVGRFMAGFKEGKIRRRGPQRPDAAMRRLAPGTRVRVEFAAERQGRITDFSFRCID